MIRTRLKAKRDKPRRNEGRVKHVRVQPKASAPPSAAEKRHMGEVAKLPCAACRKPGPSTVHHVRRRPGRTGVSARCHRRVCPLCPAHHFHDHGQDSVERIHEAGIYERFGVDLWEEAERLWNERNTGDTSQ